MPVEEQAADLKYRIKSETEARDRVVLECHLSSDVAHESEYPLSSVVRERRSH